MKKYLLPGLIKKFDKYEKLKGLSDLRKIEFLFFFKGEQ